MRNYPTRWNETPYQVIISVNSLMVIIKCFPLSLSKMYCDIFKGKNVPLKTGKKHLPQSCVYILKIMGFLL